MALSETDKMALDNLRRQILQKSEIDGFRKATENISLAGINLEDLKALVNPVATQGLDYTSLDLSTLDTDTLNTLAPGAINVDELKKKIANQSLQKGSVIDIVDTQSGVVRIESTIKANIDVEDILKSKVISQGTNLKMINLAKQIRVESVTGKLITSKFVEEV